MRVAKPAHNAEAGLYVLTGISLNPREGVAAHTAYPDVAVVSRDQSLFSEFRRQENRNQSTLAEPVKTGRRTHPNAAFSIFQNAYCIITARTILGGEALDGIAKPADLLTIQPVRKRNAPHA